MSGALRKRAGNHDALFFAAGQRVEQTRLEMKRAGCAQRVARNLEIVGAFDLERAQMRIAAHHRHLEHRVLEGELRLLRHHRHPPRDVAARGIVRRSTPSSRRDPPAGCNSPPSSRSSVVLPEPFGPRMPTRPPRGNSGADTPSSTADARRR